MSVMLGVDLGTAYSRIYSPQSDDIIVEMPTVAALGNDGEPVAFGEEVSAAVSSKKDLKTVRPVRSGAVTDFDTAANLLKHMLLKNTQSIFKKTHAAVCVPMSIGDVERHAVEEAVISAGMNEVSLIEVPLAAAIGAGIDVTEPKGYVIADIGAGTAEAAVISLGGVVTSRSVKTAGEEIDNSIIGMIKKRYNVEIAPSTAEKVKHRLASAFSGMAVDIAAVKGKDMYSGTAKTVNIGNREVYDAIRDDINKIVDMMRSLLEDTPPELAADLIDTGIILTGGGAALRGLGKLIERSCGVRVYMAEDPVHAAVRGAGIALTDRSLPHRLLFRTGERKTF